ncbi:MAG TPA: translesion DNA synthesis-associated protein ImuA [Eoetvoesiella sp.]
MNAIKPPALLHPECIHPLLWLGSQLAMGRQNTVSTGFSPLDQELPNQGWPLSTLIELTLPQAGIGEIHLLRPALAKLAPERSIALVHPPYPPHFHCWVNWQLETHRLLWINPKTASDSLWASEQILKHNACSALLCWVPSIRPEALRRLQLAAQQSDALFVLLRPHSATRQTSAAPLRLSLRPVHQGLEVSIVKRRGPTCSHPVLIKLYPSRPYAKTHSSYVPLDQSVLALSQPRRNFSPLAQ